MSSPVTLLPKVPIMQHQPLFICFEGIDGAGKSTQLDRLYTYLVGCGIDVIKTREPGGTPLAEHIREGMLSTDLTESVSPMTELLMVYAARQQHLDNVIRPALTKGTWVLCDRFIDTTYAYQIRGRCLSPALFHQLNDIVVRDTKPDLTLFFTLPDEVYRARLAGRTEKSDRLDRESHLFAERVIGGLKERARFCGHPTVMADGTIEEVTERMLDTLRPYSNLPEAA